MAKKVLVVDAGHGGNDPGACANGREEKTLNWEIATMVAMEARKRGFEATVVPHTVEYTSGENRLANRVKAASRKQADYFISFHWNSGPSGAKGSEGWYRSGDAKGEEFAKAVAKAISDTMDTVYRGVKPDTENRHKRLGILHGHDRNTKACLIEVGFISSPTDLRHYAEKKQAIVTAIVDAMEVKP